MMNHRIHSYFSLMMFISGLTLSGYVNSAACDEDAFKRALQGQLSSVQPPLTEAQQMQIASALIQSGFCASLEAPQAAQPRASDQVNQTTVKTTPQAESSVWPPEPRQDFVIRSQIEGTFKGWRGETVFKLTNGQRWVQRRRSYYRTELVEPEIEITKNAMGFYMLEVLSSGRKVHVKPVRD